jgi:amino acid transporter
MENRGGVKRAPEPTLRRAVSLPWLVLYGLGTTIGAGIYALTDVVAGRAGMRAPVAFLGTTAVLAFYAFLGFEDMVNVAEEVRDVRRNLPIAILATFALANLALLRVERRDPHPTGVRIFPTWNPAVGFVLTCGLIVLDLVSRVSAA